jgi:UDP-glucose 4-epimerase
MSKILVTGCAGFLGSHVCEALIADGHEVVGVDDLSTGLRGNIPPEVTFHELSFFSPATRKVITAADPDVIVHLAAAANVADSMMIPDFYVENNVFGTVKLLDYMRQCDVPRIVFASSGGTIYGNLDGRDRFHEDDDCLPLSIYGATKLQVEQYLRLYFRHHEINWVALRFGNIYGPRQRIGVVPEWTRKMLRGETVFTEGDLTQRHDFVFVWDAAKAVVRACCCAGGAINIGSGVGTKLSDLFEKLSVLTDYHLAAVPHAVPLGKTSDVVLNCHLAQEALGWKATTSLDEGLAKTVESIRREA